MPHPAAPPIGLVLPTSSPPPISLADGVGLVWQDTHLGVVIKPSGLLSVPGRGPDKQDCLSTRLAAAGMPSLVVHRLDQATSGLMLFARSAQMQRQLSHAFAQRQVHKQYVACVHGRLRMTDDWQMIDAPIAADWPRRPLRIVAETGQGSQTLWRCLGHPTLTGTAPAEGSYVVLRPLSGRTHQLRVHMQHIGHPILGDALYAPPELQTQSHGLMLHAQQLGLAHPLTGEKLVFENNPAWLPSAWGTLLNALS